MPEVRIAFTSCADTDQDTVQPIWDAIAAKNPDYVLFLGDVIYMDWKSSGAPIKWLQEGEPGYARFLREMHQRYSAQWSVVQFQSLLRSMGDENARRHKFLCTWDNHDFGWNDSCGMELPGADNSRVLPPRAKAISKALHLQFVKSCVSLPSAYPEIPHDLHRPDLAPTDAEEGLERVIQLPHLNQVAVELLDTRWYRTPIAANPNAYLLGQKQLRDLVTSVSKETRRLSIIASSCPYFHSYANEVESWAGKGLERPDYQRFQQLLKSLPRLRDNVVFLSGDTHNNNRIPDDPSTFRQFESSPAVPRPWIGKGIFGFFSPGKATCFGLLKVSGESESGPLTCHVEQFKDTKGSYQIDKKLPPYSWSTHVN